jgi:hypothetical protein
VEGSAEDRSPEVDEEPAADEPKRLCITDCRLELKGQGKGKGRKEGRKEEKRRVTGGG